MYRCIFKEHFGKRIYKKLYEDTVFKISNADLTSYSFEACFEYNVFL